MRNPGADRPVVVVGAGPTGLTVALLLARHGVATLVLERRTEAHPQPRAVHLDDEAVRILQQVGVADAFARLSRPGRGLRLLDARHRPFAVFERGRSAGWHGWPEANLFHQPDLEGLLRAEVDRQPLVTLRAGTEVVAVERHDGGATATVTDPAGGDPRRVPAAAVLGCDGAASTVRGEIGSRLRDLGHHERWFVLDVRCARPLPGWGGVDQVCDPRRAATFLTLPGEGYRWEFRMRADDTAAAMLARLDPLTAPWRDGAPVTELHVVRAAEYVFRACLADRWRAERVLLLGDAAHATPPFIGQGLGAGLRDAHNLAWKLAAVLRGALPESVLESYQRERERHAGATVRGAVRIGRAMTGGAGLAAAVRRPVAAALLRVPAVRTRAAAGIGTRHPAGELVERRRHRRDLSGTACPQPDVVVDGRRTRLDDVLGAGWAVIAAGPVPAALRERGRRLHALVVLLEPAARGDALLPGDALPDDALPDDALPDDALPDDALPDDALPGGALLPGEALLPGDVLLRDDGTLAAWLAGGRAVAALVRPDRIVAATAHHRRCRSDGAQQGGVERQTRPERHDDGGAARPGHTGGAEGFEHQQHRDR